MFNLDYKYNNLIAIFNKNNHKKRSAAKYASYVRTCEEITYAKYNISTFSYVAQSHIVGTPSCT